MPSPTYAWTDISTGVVDQDSEVDVTLWEAMRRNQVFLKEVLYGTGSFVGNVPHAHLGTEDAAVSFASTPNLLSDSAPDIDSTRGWTVSGYTVQDDKGFLTTTTANHYASQIIAGLASVSKAAMGAGADMMLSIFVRAQSTVPTAGELHFGLADGATPTTFKTGCKGVISYTSITTAHQRFYMPLLAATTGSWTTDCRFLLKNHSTAPNQPLLVTAMAACIGAQLIYWSPGLLDNELLHENWHHYGISDCPIWDELVARTSAVYVAGA